MHIRVASGFNGQHCYFRAVRYCCPITLNTNPKRKSQTAREKTTRARETGRPHSGIWLRRHVGSDLHLHFFVIWSCCPRKEWERESEREGGTTGKWLSVSAVCIRRKYMETMCDGLATIRSSLEDTLARMLALKRKEGESNLQLRELITEASVMFVDLRRVRFYSLLHCVGKKLYLMWQVSEWRIYLIKV